MPLSPHDIQHTEFHDQWRGYNQEEVDDFLDRVAESLDELQRENTALQTRIRELDQAVATSRETEEMLKKTLVTAQQAAEQAIATAKEKAEKLLEEAEARVRKVNQEADERVSQVQAEVTAKAADVQRQYDLRKRELDATIERLTSYESELKQKLKTFLEQQKTYLEQQLRSLETLNSKNGTSASRPSVSTSTAPMPRVSQTDRPQATPSVHMQEQDDAVPEGEDLIDPTLDAQPARRGVRGLFWRDES
jgi:cell division initiation protein